MKIVSEYIEAHVARMNNGIYEFLILKRAKDEKIYPGVWQMVTGKINSGEKAYQAAFREIAEETGLKIDKLFVVPTISSFYLPDAEKINFSPVFCSLINMVQIVNLSDEHDEYKWIIFDEIEKFIPWENQKKSARLINEFLTKGMHNSGFIAVKNSVSII